MFSLNFNLIMIVNPIWNSGLKKRNPTWCLLAKVGVKLIKFHIFEHSYLSFKKKKSLHTKFPQVHRKQIRINALYSFDRCGPYWYWNGFNPNAIVSVLFAGLMAIAALVLPSLLSAGPFQKYWHFSNLYPLFWKPQGD